MRVSRVSLIALAAVLALPVFAQNVVDDTIRLAQGGVGEDVIVAWAEKQNAGSLSADDIIHMKDGKVPDRVIATLIRNANTSGYRYVPQQQQRQQIVDASAQSVVNESAPVQYVQPASVTYVSSDYSYPAYYSSYYPYYGGYYGGYYGRPYYGYGYGGYGYGYGLGIGLAFNFGNGHYHGGYGHYHGGGSYYHGGGGYHGGGYRSGGSNYVSHYSGGGGSRGGFSGGGFLGAAAAGKRDF